VSGPLAGDVPTQYDEEAWPRMREMFARVFLTRTRDEWAAAFEGVDGCVAPVLDLAEAPDGAHLAARGTFTEAFDIAEPRRRPGCRARPTASGRRRSTRERTAGRC
jgi:alpha-methylacyl-CoA racemase